MHYYRLIKRDYAVSELVGGMVLLLIAVSSITSIYLFVFPLPFESDSINVELAGFVDREGYTFIKHMGGDYFETYNNRWEIGGIFDNIPRLYNESNRVRVMIFSTNNDGLEEILFDGILNGNFELNDSSPYPYMLVSSLTTNSSAEDLICFNYIIKDLYPNASRFVYNWLVNGFPIADVILTFDVNSSNFTRDYSGNGNDGEVVSAKWTNEGIIGGAYYFDGASDHISFNNLPNVFNAIYRFHFG